MVKLLSISVHGDILMTQRSRDRCGRCVHFRSAADDDIRRRDEDNDRPPASDVH